MFRTGETVPPVMGNSDTDDYFGDGNDVTRSFIIEAVAEHHICCARGHFGTLIKLETFHPKWD